MELMDGGDVVDGNHSPEKEFTEGFSDIASFNASQYAFFGKDVLEEVELGGLEDDEDDAALIGLGDDEFRFSSFGDREEVYGTVSPSDVDDLAATFDKINKVASGPRNLGNIGDRRSFSLESECLCYIAFVHYLIDLFCTYVYPMKQIMG